MGGGGGHVRGQEALGRYPPRCVLLWYHAPRLRVRGLLQAGVLRRACSFCFFFVMDRGLGGIGNGAPTGIGNGVRAGIGNGARGPGLETVFGPGLATVLGGRDWNGVRTGIGNSVRTGIGNTFWDRD